MEYRLLGRTNLRVSAIGLGGHEYRRRAFVHNGRFTALDPQRPHIVRAALDLGVNYFDTTFTEEAQSLGATLQALGVPRASVVINGMGIDLLRRLQDRAPSAWRAYIEAEVAERLELVRSDYLDIFSICGMESGYSPERLEGALEVLYDLRSRGWLRHVGASCHNPQLIAQVIAERDPFAMVMVPINYARGVRPELLQAVRSHNVGLVAIKPFVWGHYGLSFVPVCGQAMAAQRLPSATLAQMALRWVLRHEEVSTVIPSANSLVEVQENAAAGDLSAAVVDEAVLEACRTYPGRMEETIALIDHPYQDYRDYSLQAVKTELGQDCGLDKARYLALWQSKEKGAN